jgi:hypothetical protein
MCFGAQTLPNALRYKRVSGVTAPDSQRKFSANP